MAITGLTTFLWFDTQALEAAEFYVQTFPNSSLGTIHHMGGDDGPILTASFILFGQEFTALNGGPLFEHSPAISFQVFCESQDEVDDLWSKLTEDGGEEGRCGWCKDRFGISWQVIPHALGERLSDPDPAVSQRAHAAMMAMGKIVIADLS